VNKFSSISAILSTVIAVCCAEIAGAVPLEARYPVAPNNSNSLACYMEMDNGTTLDLTGLCGRSISSYRLSRNSGEKTTKGCPAVLLKNSVNKDSLGGLTYVHGYTRQDGTSVGGYTCKNYDS
jgi:hypothetical protein